MTLALFSLLLCLATLTAPVDSFPVSSSMSSRVLSDSTFVSFRRTFGSQRAKSNDDTDDTDDDSKLSSSSSTGQKVDFDWKYVAGHVFDETIESAEDLHSKPIILFDGVCNLCDGGVNFAIDHDRKGKFRFASLQSNVAKALLLRDGKDPFTTADIVLVTREKCYYSSEAVSKILTSLDLPILKFFGVLGQVTPSFARNLVYRLVSGNRFILGENESCRLDFDGEYTWRFVSDPPQPTDSTTEDDNKTDK
eukprot:CAMPEP_0172403180 /NCGR_PEP_ID=MMETSP1061-20121228/58154_1 /TAXON_ID=37318 /ORGANISM="Pseudo-nitzschia pungens, Strain cf. pungens" /LENGTH=249 /DNA_ID=CAMNT_0013137483 /DNA_START=12 /DNA_END=761 /DNA_ORIENTATION=-